MRGGELPYGPVVGILPLDWLSLRLLASRYWLRWILAATWALLVTAMEFQARKWFCLPSKIVHLSPNPPKDTDGRREDRRRGMRELQGRWPGLDWGRWEVGGGTSVTAQAPNGRLRELGCAGWQENRQQGTPAELVGASWRGRWVSGMLAVRLGVEWLAAGPGRG